MLKGIAAIGTLVAALGASPAFGEAAGFDPAEAVQTEAALRGSSGSLVSQPAAGGTATGGSRPAAARYAPERNRGTR